MSANSRADVGAGLWHSDNYGGEAGCRVKKRWLVSIDWDGTIREGILFVDFGKFLAKHGQFDVATLGRISNFERAYRSGDVTYQELARVLPREYAFGLRGLSVRRHAELTREFVDSRLFREKIFPWTEYLSAFLHGAPALTSSFISGAPQEILECMAHEMGVREVNAVRLDVRNDSYSGHIEDNPAPQARKQELIEHLGKDLEIVLGVGDSLSDIAIVEPATFRVVVGHVLRGRWGPSVRVLELPTGGRDKAERVTTERFFVELRAYVRGQHIDE